MAMIADLLVQKAGLTAEQAASAEQVISEHLTSKVPTEFQSLLGPVLGTAPGQSAGGDLLGTVEKMFGSKA